MKKLPDQQKEKCKESKKLRSFPLNFACSQNPTGSKPIQFKYVNIFLNIIN